MMNKTRFINEGYEDLTEDVPVMEEAFEASPELSSHVLAYLIKTSGASVFVKYGIKDEIVDIKIGKTHTPLRERG